jgi:hypothetical protein
MGDIFLYPNRKILFVPKNSVVTQYGFSSSGYCRTELVRCTLRESQRTSVHGVYIAKIGWGAVCRVSVTLSGLDTSSVVVQFHLNRKPHVIFFAFSHTGLLPAARLERFEYP